MRKCRQSRGRSNQGVASEAVAQLVQTWVRDRQAERPSTWREAVVVLLPKWAVRAMFGDLRPIILLAVTEKLFLRTLLRLMRPWVSLAEPWTMGFRAAYQPSELTRSVIGVSGVRWRSVGRRRR